MKLIRMIKNKTPRFHSTIVPHSSSMVGAASEPTIMAEPVLPYIMPSGKK
jgi:hypothetical protein